MKFITLLLIILSLTGCAEAQQTSEQIVVDGAVERVSAEVIAPMMDAPAERAIEDYSEMSIPELEAETERVKIFIEELEIVMFALDEEDSEKDDRWDILHSYNERAIELSGAMVARQKERTQRSCALVKGLGGECAN